MGQDVHAGNKTSCAAARAPLQPMSIINCPLSISQDLQLAPLLIIYRKIIHFSAIFWLPVLLP
jgi:hypothetical protein